MNAVFCYHSICSCWHRALTFMIMPQKHVRFQWAQGKKASRRSSGKSLELINAPLASLQLRAFDSWKQSNEVEDVAGFLYRLWIANWGYKAVSIDVTLQAMNCHAITFHRNIVSDQQNRRWMMKQARRDMKTNYRVDRRAVVKQLKSSTSSSRR